MQVVPREVAFAVAKLDSYNCNTFRLETNGATSAGPSSIVTLSLPANAVLDLRSFKVHLDVYTTGDASGTNAVYGKLPADTSSLISSVEVYASGIQISSGFSEYNTVSRINKLCNTSRDRDGSIDSTLSHGMISSTDALDVVSIIFKPNIGLFAESSTRYLPTSIVGDISVRITMAPASGLCYKETGLTIGTAFSDASVRASAAMCSYYCNSIHATVSTVTLGSAYEAMLLDRLTREDYLSVNFKEYYSFSLHGSSGAKDVRFSLSASSIDRIYTVMRDSNYQTAGIKTQKYLGASLADSSCSNALHFRSYNSEALVKGSLKYQYSVNNVQHPQYQADVLDAVHELSTLAKPGNGNMICFMTDWNIGKAIIPLQLCMTQPIKVMSGYNSRGNNTQFSVSLQGIVVPVPDVAAQISSTIITLVVVETTAQLRIGGGRQISVSY
jgi:hypothetical protein